MINPQDWHKIYLVYDLSCVQNLFTLVKDTILEMELVFNLRQGIFVSEKNDQMIYTIYKNWLNQHYCLDCNNFLDYIS